MRIVLVAGARPNFMKIAPIIRALKGAAPPILSRPPLSVIANRSENILAELGVYGSWSDDSEEKTVQPVSLPAKTGQPRLERRITATAASSLLILRTRQRAAGLWSAPS